MEDILMAIKKDEYTMLVAECERLNILRKYLEEDKYLDNKTLRLIVGDRSLGGTIIKVGD